MTKYTLVAVEAVTRHYYKVVEADTPESALEMIADDFDSHTLSAHGWVLDDEVSEESFVLKVKDEGGNTALIP